MIRGLKVALVLYGLIHILQGLAFIIAPHQVASMLGFSDIAHYVPYLMALLGGCFIAVAVWFIVAGRDPMQHISLVKLAILWSVLGVVTGSYSVIQGSVNFNQASVGIIEDAIFAIAFLAFYPYRRN